MKLARWTTVAALAAAPLVADADLVSLHAAGSLRTALGEVSPSFGPSGLMRERIEGGETAHVFASASMRHPRTLQAAGRGGPVALFARNRLCALAQPEMEVTSATLPDTMLAEGIRLGTSTPGADPSGDYAWQLFDRAEGIRAGAAEALKAKALRLTGGPDSPSPPAGRNTYGWVMGEDRADLFLTCCTNAVLARREVEDLQIVPIPSELSVGADSGLIVVDGAPPEAWRLALHILSPDGQATLASHGFEAPGLPEET